MRTALSAAAVAVRLHKETASSAPSTRVGARRAIGTTMEDSYEDGNGMSAPL